MSQDSPQVTELKTKLYQTHHDLEYVTAQLQQITIDLNALKRSEDILKSIGADDTVYRRHAYAMVKSTRDVVLADIEEQRALANTKNTVLKKQETRLKTSLEEYASQLKTMGVH